MQELVSRMVETDKEAWLTFARDIFYKNNKTNFFKDRQWCDREFDILSEGTNEGEGTDRRKLKCLEVGCGVGNFLFPTLNKTGHLFIYACDFSKRAIDMVKSDSRYDPERVNAFQADLTDCNTILSHIEANSIDIVTCLFVLSAIPPSKMALAIETMARVLKPDGKLLFRDYALDDSAQSNFHLRSSSSYTMPSRLDPDIPWYIRGDKTMTYFFAEKELSTMMAKSDLVPESEDGLRVLERRTINVKLDKDIKRLFLQGQFVKKIRAGSRLQDLDSQRSSEIV